MDSSDDSSDEWNVRKDKVKSEHIACTYKQVYQVNPLMGGFSNLAEKYEDSDFKVYQFTGEYKVGANGNNVVLTTTSACSQMAVSFVRALVVFQQKVTPQKAFTKCQQDVVFNANEYTMVISPFEQHQIDVGTMILASNGKLMFTTFNLPSRTDQDKISKALYDYLISLSTKAKSVSGQNGLIAGDTPPTTGDMPTSGYDTITVKMVPPPPPPYYDGPTSGSYQPMG